MRLVIDSNRFIAGLIKDSVCRKLILHKDLAFYSPDAILGEIDKYSGYLIEKSGTAERDFKMLEYTLLENITLVPYEELEEEFDEALRIMEPIDVKDAPFLVVGIAVKAEGIWTDDNHFQKQDRLKTYTTKELMAIFK
jgi:predicted nucleic acid-binding protein